MLRRHLGEFEHLLLLALARLGDEATGTTVRRVIADRTGRTLSPGAIYTGLDRLERRGLIASELGDPTPQRGGKRQRRYRLRPSGAAALADARATLAQMSRGLKPRWES
jgi:DNA-binding PadR family transcriptional regulator